MTTAEPTQTLRAIAARLRQGVAQRLPPTLRGAVDYLRSPELGNRFGGPLNGQDFRRRIVDRLFDTVAFDMILETGTYRGTTTEYLASKGMPVLSVEQDARAYGFSLARLWSRRNVTLRRGDSAAVVREWVAPHSPAHRAKLFCYLDAHWNDALPLWDELHAILGRPGDAVVVIDDFAVPGDAGYGFDAYSPQNILDVARLCPVVAPYDVSLWFPRCPSHEETGKRRGTVIVASARLRERLDAVPELRSWSNDAGYRD